MIQELKNIIGNEAVYSGRGSLNEHQKNKTTQNKCKINC